MTDERDERGGHSKRGNAGGRVGVIDNITGRGRGLEGGVKCS